MLLKLNWADHRQLKLYFYKNQRQLNVLNCFILKKDKKYYLMWLIKKKV